LSPSAIFSHALLLVAAAARAAFVEASPNVRAPFATALAVTAAAARDRRGISIASTRAGMSARSPAFMVQSAKAAALLCTARQMPAAPARICSGFISGSRGVSLRGS